MKFFDIRRAAEFLTAGSVRTSHESPVPIWAGFIIEQLGALMTTQDQINADVASLTDAYNQLVAANTSTAALISEQESEIASLKSQIAAGAKVTEADLSGLDGITAKIKAAAAATVTAPTVPAPAVQEPVVSAPVDTTAPVTEPAAPAAQEPVVSSPLDTSVPVDSSAESTPIADAADSSSTDSSTKSA